MTQTAVPISTVVLGSDFTLVGAATAHEALDEGVGAADDGATQVWDRNGSPAAAPLPPYTATKYARAELVLGPIATPGVGSWTLRVRWRLTSGAWPTTSGKIGLWHTDARDLANKIVEKTLDPGGLTTWQTSEWLLSAGQVAKAAPHLAALRAEIQTGSIGTYVFRVSAIELEAPDEDLGFVSPAEVCVDLAVDRAPDAALSVALALEATLETDRAPDAPLELLRLLEPTLEIARSPSSRVAVDRTLAAELEIESSPDVSLGIELDLAGELEVDTAPDRPLEVETVLSDDSAPIERELGHDLER